MRGSFINDPDYIKICNGLDRRKKVIHVSTNDTERLKQVCSLALQNSSMAIDVDGFEYIIFAGNVTVMPKHSMDKKNVNELIDKCINRRNKIISRCKTDDTYKTVVAVHDMLVRNVDYKNDGKISHTMAAPLAMKYGVCDGFSKAYKFVMDELGIPCIVVSGEAQDPATMKIEPHAWNMIQVYGKWCHVDVTFDKGLKSNDYPRYDYFGLSDEDILIDHIYEKQLYPNVNSNDMEYYRLHDSFISNKQQLVSYFKNNINEPNIVVRVGKNVPEKELIDRIISVFNETLKDCGRGVAYSYSYNIKQKVVQINVC